MLAKQMRCRPSEIYGIHYEVDAYFFDRAVTTFGLALEADLDEAGQGAKTNKEAKRKRDRVMNKWLNTTQQFADPAASAATNTVKL